MREQRLESESRRTQAAAGLLICNLQQRLMSSFEAFSRTLRVHRRGLLKRAQAIPASVKLDLLAAAPGNDDERPEEELAAEQEIQVEAAMAMTSRGDVSAELGLVDRMAALADEHRGCPDARTRKLIEWIPA